MNLKNIVTFQHLRTHVLEHILTLDKPADDGSSTSCAYRTIDGRKCIVGACISDEVYGSYKDLGRLGNPLEGGVLGPEGNRTDAVFRSLENYRDNKALAIVYLRLAQSAHDQRATASHRYTADRVPWDKNALYYEVEVLGSNIDFLRSLFVGKL